MLSFGAPTRRDVAPGSKERNLARQVSRHSNRRAAPILLAVLLLAAAQGSRGASQSSPPPSGSLESAIRQIVQSRPLASSKTSVQILDAMTGQSLFSHNPQTLLKPASNMKILTGAAALALLKPEYRFRTRFFTGSPMTAGGVVRGDLYIKGGGAPGLVGEEWWLIARHIRALGLTRIEGDLVGDDTFFDDVRRGPRWPGPSVDNPYNAPVSALSCFYNVVTVTVRPTSEGRPPEVFLEPFASYFKVVNRAVTGGRGYDLRVGRQWDGQQNIIHVEGRIGTNVDPISSHKNVEEPTLYALAAFREAAAKEGITITGGSRRGVVPHGATLFHVHESRPLADLVQDMNKESNNFMAESILKTIGAETAGPPGTAQKGAAAALRWLAGLGVRTEELVIADGSGLSTDSRLTTDALARILLATWRDFQAAPEFLASLPIGGIDGTLDGRMVGSAATRNVRAKTGFINGVSALSGYAMNEGGRVLVFSILVNNPRAGVWEINRSVDRICDAMVRRPVQAPAAPPERPASLGG